ncbi:MAG: hypothetical protein RL266_2046 [Bacteroidota bacterium]|jgi:ferritin
MYVLSVFFLLALNHLSQQFFLIARVPLPLKPEIQTIMLDKKIEKLLNHQIELEFESSQYYLSMASWAEKSGLNGVSAFLYAQADEERVHMLKLFHYINDRGGHALVPTIGAPPKEYNGAREIFTKVLQHEQIVTKEINDLVDNCLKVKDYTTHNFLQWYVAEQIEEERQAQTLIDKLDLIGTDKGGMYLFDRDMETFIVKNPGAGKA